MLPLQLGAVSAATVRTCGCDAGAQVVSVLVSALCSAAHSGIGIVGPNASGMEAAAGAAAPRVLRDESS